MEDPLEEYTRLTMRDGPAPTGGPLVCSEIERVQANIIKSGWFHCQLRRAMQGTLLTLLSLCTSLDVVRADVVSELTGLSVNVTYPGERNFTSAAQPCTHLQYIPSLTG